MFENIRLAFQGIWSHKMRSFLTMLGIIIGIASIIAIVSTIKGTSEQIKSCVRRVCHYFQITGHGSIKNNLADDFPCRTNAGSCKYMAIF